jgi:hypothetical protein
MRKFYLSILSYFFLVPISVYGVCPDYLDGMIWRGNESQISFTDLAHHAAPMLWFSPDENRLLNKKAEIQIPNAFPFEEADNPVVYYKIKTIYTDKEDPYVEGSNDKAKDFRMLNLRTVTALDLDFYYYFAEETGLANHPHDIEYMSLQIRVIRTLDCQDYKYAIIVQRVIGRAHGLHWYDNIYDVDAQSFFPVSILIEEGKHASSTDKNADGIFTPGYDVDRRINDAWGVRDIISSGRLFTGGFQAWMAKKREPESILFPPIPSSSPFYKAMKDKFNSLSEFPVYEIRPYPDYPREGLDKILNTKMKEKKHHDWPKVDKVQGDGTVKRWIKEEKAHRSWGAAYRWDDTNGIAISVPLFIFKTVEAPMTGGWLYNKINFGNKSISENQGFAYEKVLSHQIVHSTSASRWLDTYVGLGYEIHDEDIDPASTDHATYFSSEAGLKIRINITKTPLKFLRFLGTDFWGLRIGWKTVGFHPFRNYGFVVEIGAGAF